jgi:flagellar hook protein FlgE
MIDSIFTAMSGLQGPQRGLNTISNNVANMNTPGFKGSHVDFVDLIGSGNGAGQQASEDATGGGGLDASHVSLDLRAGEVKETGRDLDLALNGSGFFVVKDEAGGLHYTRNGAFEFDPDGVLIGRGNSMKVLAHDANGKLIEISLDGRKTNAPAVTANVVLTGNLSPTDTDHTIDDLAVFDKLGGKHMLKLTFTNEGVTAPDSWVVTVFEGTKQLGTGKLSFANGKPSVDKLKLSLALNGTKAADVDFTLDADATGFSSGTTSTLALKSQDGHEAGQISSLTFDDQGMLKVGYSNGQTVDGPRLALAEMQDDSGLVADGAAVYTYTGEKPPTIREAGDDLHVTGKSIELSNVDLTSEFSALILMQRGYQASSQVVSTANDMLQELFDMKGRR